MKNVVSLHRTMNLIIKMPDKSITALGVQLKQLYGGVQKSDNMSSTCQKQWLRKEVSPIGTKMVLV